MVVSVNEPKRHHIPCLCINNYLSSNGTFSPNPTSWHWH